MSIYPTLPFIFLKFYFVEAPLRLVQYFGRVNDHFLEFFSLPLLLKTFFKPLKNEYREGLVGFSIAMGIFVKTVFILVDLFLLGFLLTFEVLFVAGFFLLPFLSVFILFK